MPHTILIDCPKYSGPLFFDADKYPERKTWIPFRPITRNSEKNSLTRTQFPFVLAWAITTEKAQGMTLDSGVVAIGKKAASPGIAFTALTRFRHPDDFAIDDCFPDVSTIMRQRDKQSFQKRLKWENHMRVLFSRTLRRHFRDKNLYDPEMVWNEEESNIADQLLKYVRSDSISDASTMQTALQEKHPYITAENFQIVWERMQKWPHSCELDAANLRKRSADEINAQEIRCPSKLPLSKISAQGYYVYIDEWRHFKDHGKSH